MRRVHRRFESETHNLSLLLLEDFRAGKLAHELEYEVTFELPGGNREVHAAVKPSRLEELRVDERGGYGRKIVGAKPCGIPSEVADLIIRALHFSGKHGIDIEKAVTEKMAFNNSRPYKHGGKKI